MYTTNFLAGPMESYSIKTGALVSLPYLERPANSISSRSLNLNPITRATKPSTAISTCCAHQGCWDRTCDQRSLSCLKI